MIPSCVEDLSSWHHNFTLSMPQLGPSSQRLAHPLVTLPGFGSLHLSPVLISPSNSLGHGGDFVLSDQLTVGGEGWDAEGVELG